MKYGRKSDEIVPIILNTAYITEKRKPLIFCKISQKLYHISNFKVLLINNKDIQYKCL